MLAHSSTQNKMDSIRKYSKWFMLGIVGVFALSYLIPIISDLMGSGGPGSSGNTPATVEKPLPENLNIPKFNGDSAYFFVDKIVSFGPRVTSTPAHARVGAYILAQLKAAGATVTEQRFKSTTFDNKPINCLNIMAQFNPAATKRILLAAHWDSRPISDADNADPATRNKPVLGADDSGSGVGVLLALAQALKNTPLSNLGVDLVFFDAEDLGEKNSDKGWCLGSKEWSRQAAASGYKAQYGVLLDMVGARGARFTREIMSQRYASFAVDRVWRVARNAGYVNLFVNENSRNEMIDDHKYVNEIARVPMIDIINHPTDPKLFFGDYWHTQNDNMSIIDRETLRAVGQTLLSTLHYENAGAFNN
jgi:glutaminyl-peptide cyclotransferase